MASKKSASKKPAKAAAPGKKTVARPEPHYTKFINPDTAKRAWHVIDAKGKVLGRVATEAAALLRGKYKTTFSPSQDTGDFVIVLNSQHVELTGRKWNDKMYHWHTGFVGGVKGVTAQKRHQRHPTGLVESAVQGMLPKGPLGRKMLKKLFVYAEAEHPHKAQQPAPRALPGRSKAETKN